MRFEIIALHNLYVRVFSMRLCYSDVYYQRTKLPSTGPYYNLNSQRILTHEDHLPDFFLESHSHIVRPFIFVQHAYSA
jgi:hypothetical protein